MGRLPGLGDIPRATEDDKGRVTAAPLPMLNAVPGTGPQMTLGETPSCGSCPADALARSWRLPETRTGSAWKPKPQAPPGPNVRLSRRCGQARPPDNAHNAQADAWFRPGR